MSDPDTGRARGPYRFYVVGVLLLAYICSFADRTVLGLLVEPIKADLGLSDTGISLLSGLAFALFYTFLGLPFGWLADRVHRPRLIMIGVLVWSAMTAACGLARSFAALFAARIGVGVGEATLSPATYSLLPDYFRREELGLATGIYASGVSIGGGLAMLLGGMAVAWLEASGPLDLPLLGLLRPWQLAFVVLGASGIVVALLVLTVREPGRGPNRKAAPRLGEVRGWFSRHRRAYLPIFLGYALMVIPSYALVTWIPPFLMRSHAMGPAEAGGTLGLIMLVASTAGMIVGGLWSDRLARAGHGDAPLRVVLVSIAGQAPLFIAAMLVSGKAACLALLTGAVFALSLNGGLQGATVQTITPPTMRGQMTAAYLLCANLIALGLAPTAIGLINDRLFGDPARLGDALALVAGIALPLGFVLVWAALPHARRASEEVRVL